MLGFMYEVYFLSTHKQDFEYNEKQKENQKKIVILFCYDTR